MQGPEYGTRSQTVLVVRRDGSAELRERYKDGGTWHAVQHAFRVPLERQCHPKDDSLNIKTIPGNSSIS